MTVAPMILKGTTVKRDQLEIAVGQRLSDIAVIFAFPGLGIGEIHSSLRGCTLETQLFRDIAEIFTPLGVDLIGISSGRVPTTDAKITYVHLPQPISPFAGTCVGGKPFFSRETFVVSGPLVWAVPAINGIKEHLAVVSNLIAREIAGKMFEPIANISNLIPALIEAKSLARGADSLAILALPSKPPTVLKIGPSGVLGPEIALIEKITALGFSLFPRLHSHGAINDSRWVLMDAATPESVDRMVFEDVRAGLLRSDWCKQTAELINPMAELYDSTLITHLCQTSAYHYTRRIITILHRPDAIETARRIAQIELSIAVTTPLVINGQPISSFTDLEMRNRATMKQQPVSHVALIHGDLHISNILRRRGEEGFVLIDPRVAWDEEPIDRFGYGDPLYDLATMFHSIGAMATILARLANGTDSTLATVLASEKQLVIDLDPILLATLQTALNGFLDIAVNILPAPCLGSNWRKRLLVGAAGAFIGWLKYAEAVRSRAAWWAIFSAASLCLAEAEQ